MDVFVITNIKGAMTQKLLITNIISDNAHLMPRHMAKFRGIIFFNPKVMGANTLNFKPIFDPPL